MISWYITSVFEAIMAAKPLKPRIWERREWPEFYWSRVGSLGISSAAPLTCRLLAQCIDCLGDGIEPLLRNRTAADIR